MELEGAGEAAAREAAWAGPLTTRIRKLPSVAEAWAWLAAQGVRQGERWILWTPVSFGLGAALYFALRREPQLWVA